MAATVSRLGTRFRGFVNTHETSFILLGSFIVFAGFLLKDWYTEQTKELASALSASSTTFIMMMEMEGIRRGDHSIYEFVTADPPNLPDFSKRVSDQEAAMQLEVGWRMKAMEEAEFEAHYDLWIIDQVRQRLTSGSADIEKARDQAYLEEERLDKSLPDRRDEISDRVLIRKSQDRGKGECKG